mmetsp:Transcript_12256/g.35396  ORF Transcript_12256/g.35396 Transcript_12256/m.35396 type:complete len:206 (+) Transcript_12256:231-848(+)
MSAALVLMSRSIGSSQSSAFVVASASLQTEKDAGASAGQHASRLAMEERRGLTWGGCQIGSDSDTNALISTGVGSKPPRSLWLLDAGGSGGGEAGRLLLLAVRAAMVAGTGFRTAARDRWRDDFSASGAAQLPRSTNWSLTPVGASLCMLVRCVRMPLGDRKVRGQCGHWISLSSCSIFMCVARSLDCGKDRLHTAHSYGVLRPC